ncbi:GTPase [Seohaeicola zhoushanensis]|uniref:G domain-containing protein n=1 Tax=Seohaeicola zhoushanensis TaxID=1569283 RepID=A0A8J3H1V9_9RHOB|nr:GTPase [Seohaeicola zhoushanensis]GHF65935.1 hypothetical protein GCM10017056_41430 [Seohaeicola zhoushanensis]
MNARNMTLMAQPGQPPVARRPVRVVVCGEVNSGKSSAINALARANVSPAFFGLDRRPVVRLRHGPRPHAIVDFPGGRSELHDRIESCPNLAEATSCQMVIDAPHLAGLELIELSFPEDGRIPPETMQILAEADLLVWTTIASQAWRLTERNLVAQMPRPLHQRATLVVTRGDKLRLAADIRRVHRRLIVEACEFFDAVVFMGAAKRTIEASAESEESYIRSGGRDLATALRGFAAQIAAIPGRLDIAAPAPRPVGAPGRPAALPPVEGPDAEAVQALRDWVAGMNGILAAGIADAETGDCLHPLGGAPELAASTATFARAARTGDAAEDTMVEIDGHQLVIRPTEDGQLLFLLCQSGKITRSIAGAALARMVRLWDQRD